MANCESCYSSFEGDCISCSDGFVLDPNGICVPQCQTGSNLQSQKCVPKNAKAKILHYVFNTTVNNPPDKTANLKGYMGSTSKYLGEFDSNDPVPYYKRGIYFDGDQKYVQLPPNPEDSTNVVVGNTHSIKFWLRPRSTSSAGCLLSKESSESLIYIYLTSGLVPKAEYALNNIYTGSELSLIVTGDSLTSNAWQELVFVFTRSGRSSSGVFYLNGKQSIKSYTKKSFLSEAKDLNFKLGYSTVKDTSYKGFVYEFIIYNYAISPSDPKENPCYCDLCTETGDCLSECEITEYIIPVDTCQTCPSECPSGCRSSTNCGQNEDPLCKEYSGFELKQCTKCINLAELTQSGCKCVENSNQVSNTCVCKSNYEQVDNSCVLCYYHLQSADIDGYFSEDYLSLVFDLNQAVQSSSSSSCESLFEQETLALLGDSPKCKWTESYKRLVVTFGSDAGVVNGTQVLFSQNSLLTNTATCGSFRGPIEDNVYFKFEVPVVYPTAAIDAPDEYFIYCGDLSVSGSQSSGGYGRALSYSWVFESTPYLDAFNLSDSTKQSYTFENSTLDEATVKAYLTVTNWLGFNNTVSQDINVNQGIGINLIIDKDIVWTLTTQMSKSIYVQASSECTISDNLTYTWTLFSKEGKDASINEKLFWASQKTPSKLFIPKGSLGPGYYIFQLLVQDNELNIEGKGYLKFKVLYSDLEVYFNPAYKTVNRKNDLDLDGSVAYDPDQIKETMEYNWTCKSVENCDSLIKNSQKEAAKISKGDLINLQEYVFTLTVTKGSRQASADLTVLVNDSSSISVTFDKLPKYINNQENFVIRSYLTPECNCTYSWDITGGVYELSTEPNSKDIGFVPYSLKEGSKYIAQLTITDVNGEVSIAKQGFTVNIPPINGKFRVNKASGTELTTLVFLKAPGWIDSEDDSLPLTYQFGYYKENQTFYLNMKNESNYLWTKLPNGSPLTVFVRIYDLYGSYSEDNLDLEIESGVLDFESLINEFQRYINLTWIDPDLLVGYLCNLAWALKVQNSNSTLDDLAFEAGVQAIVKVRDSLQEVDFSKIDVLLKLTSVETFFDLEFTDRVYLYQLLTSFTQIIFDEKVIMSASRAESYVFVLLKLLEFSPDVIISAPEDLSATNDILKQLSIASSLTMGQTQSLTFGSAPIQSYLKLYQGDDLISFETPSDFNHSFVSLPQHPSLQFKSSSTIMTILTVFNGDPDLFNNTSEEHSAAVEFTLVELVNNTQNILILDLDDQRINISIPIWYLNDYPPKCKYWGTRKWLGTGCKLLEFGTDLSICGCTHTSLYTSGSFFGDTSDDDEGPILIYIVCILALLWLLLACCLLVKDRKESESKVFVGKILAALPAGKKSPRYIQNEIADQLGRGLPEGSRKGTLHIPPSKIEVVDVQNEKNIESGNYSGNLSAKLRQNQSSKYEELRNEEAAEDEIRNRRLALPLGYQILPTDSFLQSKKEAEKEKLNPEKSDSFKPTGVFQIIEKIPDFQESEKAAGYVVKGGIGGVSEFRYEDPSEQAPNRIVDSEYASTARFAEIQRFESGHSIKPRSDLTTSSSGQIKGVGKDAGRVKVNVNDLQQGENYSKKQVLVHGEYVPGEKLPQLSDLEEFDLVKSEQRDFEYTHGPGLPKPGPFEGAKRSGHFNKPPSGATFSPAERLPGVSQFEYGKMMGSEEKGKTLSFSASGEIRLTEIEPRPSTDGKKMNQELGLSGTVPINIEAYEEDENQSRLPTSHTGHAQAPGHRMGGLTELKMSEVKLKEIEKTDAKGGYVQGARLQGVSKYEEENNEVFVYQKNNPGSYMTGPRLQGVSEFQVEKVREVHVSESGLPNIAFSSRSRLEGVTEFNASTNENYKKKIEIDQKTANFNYSGKSGIPGLIQYHEGNIASMRSPLESPENQEFERKAFMHHDEKGLHEGDIVEEDLSDRKYTDKRPTQPYEDKNSNKKIFNFEDHEESKEPQLGIKLGEYGKGYLNPQIDEKNPEKTELFTQPDSPHTRHMIRRKKGADQEAPVFDDDTPVVYPSFIADYYFSAILFYHENYSRFSRCAQGVCSFFLQTILIGLIVDGMGGTYADDKGQSLESQVSGLLFQDVAISFSMVIVSNFIVGMMICVFFRRPKIVPGMEETYRNRKKEFIGLVIIIVIIFGTVIGVGLLEMSMRYTMSMLWLICLFVAFIFDFFLIQILKVLVYNYFSPGFILPS